MTNQSFRHPAHLRADFSEALSDMYRAFKALSEPFEFKTEAGWETAHHTARFGEIEQRGGALMPKGRALYDVCLA